ncbi:MAG: hypothetical protein JSS75_03615 [Bacteroidetes bacterium]|nr:hypothetical protein [Bacteroidota bacterium]
MTIAAGTSVLVAIVMLFGQTVRSQPTHRDAPDQPTRGKADPTEFLRSIDDLMHDRLDRLRQQYGPALMPEHLRVEANYVRTDAPTGEVVLHESSFNLLPRYMTYSPEGRRLSDTVMPSASRSVMYFVGSARTPLSLPIVSNLTKVLTGDEASYTVYIGLLPLPKPMNVGRTDSISFYCVLQRAIESNRTDNKVPFERYAKEFTLKLGEPVRLRLETSGNDNKHFIVRLDDGSTLNFYEDFAQHFKEDILLNGERLNFSLGKANVSSISSTVSIPYTIAEQAHVQLDLLSVVDPNHPLHVIDSVVPPADYLAEHDVKQFPNGTYRYRLTATDPATNAVLFTETKSFDKSEPVIVGHGVAMVDADTLEVGGKKVNTQQLLADLNHAVEAAQVRTELLNETLKKERGEKEALKKIVDANKDNISGLRIRGGLGFGAISGMNLFAGVESAFPALSLDVSYGVMYSTSVPYLTYDAPTNFSQIFKSPKSLGLQLGYSPVKLFDGVVSPVVKLGFYGIYSATTATASTGIHSASILAPMIGITSTPGGPNTDFGLDLTAGPAFGLGLSQSTQFELQFRVFAKF